MLDALRAGQSHGKTVHPLVAAHLAAWTTPDLVLLLEAALPLAHLAAAHQEEPS